MSSGRHISTGRSGEQAAVEYLKKHGHIVLEKNYRNGKHEIDLISLSNGILVFTEVKTRTGTGFGMPEEAVNAKKRVTILKTAEQYILEHNRPEDIRFDILALQQQKDGSYKITVFEDAF